MDAEDEDQDGKVDESFDSVVKKIMGQGKSREDAEKIAGAINRDYVGNYGEGLEIDESYATLVNKIKKSGKSEKAAKAIAGAVASYKAKGGGKGPTSKQK